MTAPDGTTTDYSYNGLLNTVSTKANGAIYNNHTTTTETDVWGRAFSVTPPTGPGIGYTYDELDHLKTATRGPSSGSGQATTTLTYDKAGRKTAMTDPDMGSWTYAYDALGSLTLQKDARAQRICLYYDSLNRLAGKHYRADDNCPASPTYDVSYGYDAGANGKGRRTSMTDASGSTSWLYDARGRMIKETKTLTGNPAFITEWDYNSADLPKWMKYPDGEVVNYDYNDRMLLDNVIGTNTYVSSTAYDSAGRMTNRALGNGLTQAYSYYPWNVSAQGGRLQNLTTGSLQNINYTYDPVGNISQITNNTASETNTYGYDTLDRLTSWTLNGTPETYTYDPATGNLDVKAGVDLNYNDAAHKHAVTHIGATQKYWYDQNGNQTTRIVGADTFNLIYDAENRLVEVKKNSVSMAAFVYDGDGRRVKSVMGSETILFAGAHYEIKNPGSGQTVTKYYGVYPELVEGQARVESPCENTPSLNL